MQETINLITTGVLSLNTGELMLVAGAVATGLQFLLNELKRHRSTEKLSKPVNVALSFLIPLLIGGLGYVLEDGSLLAKGGVTYLSAQLLYYTIKAFADLAVKRTVPQAQSGEF